MPFDEPGAVSDERGAWRDEKKKVKGEMQEVMAVWEKITLCSLFIKVLA